MRLVHGPRKYAGTTVSQTPMKLSESRESAPGCSLLSAEALSHSSEIHGCIWAAAAASYGLGRAGSAREHSSTAVSQAQRELRREGAATSLARVSGIEHTGPAQGRSRSNGRALPSCSPELPISWLSAWAPRSASPSLPQLPALDSRRISLGALLRSLRAAVVLAENSQRGTP